MMPRFRFSIAALGFWIALVAANCFFFVELTRTIEPSMVLVAMFLALPVINMLVIGLRSLLFGPSRRRAFWFGFELTAAVGFGALLIAAYWNDLDLLGGVEDWLNSTYRYVLGPARYASFRYEMWYETISIGILGGVVCLPILVPAIAVGIIVGRRARQTAVAAPTAVEEIQEPC